MPSAKATPAVYLVHSDRDERDRLRTLFARHGFGVRGFPTADSFLNAYEPGGQGCLVIELNGRGSYELLERLRAAAGGIPVITIAERGDVRAAVRAVRAGASALIEKPYADSVLMREIRHFLVFTNKSPP